eukprot:CAMPEP_0118988192 /NCGR_PEP_ID=MMETSP1173-20130426/45697_1 /TAXON_ID=1034831 /ORGANISM="Rhizochromulina marina cf, Strain CCMP1243" /LENGTH=75 /DNA_ID=CAMNT_0006939105 /DNA_START=273 /DNA_END=500 /DNA_ORIENTATION=+
MLLVQNFAVHDVALKDRRNDHGDHAIEHACCDVGQEKSQEERPVDAMQIIAQSLKEVLSQQRRREGNEDQDEDDD